MRFPDLTELTWANILLPVEKQMLVVVALFALLVPLADWEFDMVRAAPLEALGAFAVGVIFGVMTGVRLMVRHRWRR
jgi:hypothetical protein